MQNKLSEPHIFSTSIVFYFYPYLFPLYSAQNWVIREVNLIFPYKIGVVTNTSTVQLTTLCLGNFQLFYFLKNHLSFFF